MAPPHQTRHRQGGRENGRTHPDRLSIALPGVTVSNPVPDASISPGGRHRAGEPVATDAVGSASVGPAVAPGAAPPLDPKRWLALAVIGISQLMVILDATIVNIALPRRRPISASPSPTGNGWSP